MYVLVNPFKNITKLLNIEVNSGLIQVFMPVTIKVWHSHCFIEN